MPSGADRAFRLAGALLILLAGLACAPDDGDVSRHADVGRGPGDMAMAGTPSDAAAPGGEVAEAGLPAGADVGPGLVGRLVVNEALPVPPEDAGEWLELTVVGDGPVALGDYAIVDDDPEHAPVPLPTGALAPGMFLRVDVVEDAAAGVASLPYGLGREDALHLILGGVRVDTLRWSAALVDRDRSVGRLPDGTGAPVSLTPTPGAPNRGFSPSGGLFDGDRVRTITLTFADVDWETISAPGALGPVPGTLDTGDGAGTRAVTVTRDAAAPDEWSLAPVGGAGAGEGALVLACPAAPIRALADVVALETARDAALVVPAATLAAVAFPGTTARLCALREAVDAPFASRRLGASTGLFRVRPPAADLRFRGRAPEAYEGLSALHAEADVADFIDLVRALGAGDPAAYPVVLDVEETLRFLAFQALIVDTAGYGGEATHLALSAQAGRLTPLAIGMPGAFGFGGCDCTADERLAFPLASPTCGPPAARPLAERLLSVPALHDAYLAQVRALLDGPLATDRLSARIAAWRAVAASGPVPAAFGAELAAFGPARLDAARVQVMAGLPAGAPAAAACAATASAD